MPTKLTAVVLRETLRDHRINGTRMSVKEGIT
jgi:hypothetical protein